MATQAIKAFPCPVGILAGGQRMAIREVAARYVRFIKDVFMAFPAKLGYFFLKE